MAGDPEAARSALETAEKEGRRQDPFVLALFYATKDREREKALELIEREAHTRGGVYIDDVRAWALYRLGRFEEADAASRLALSLGTKDARLLYHAGAIRVARGDAQGRALIEEALRLNPKFDWTGAREARALLAAK
jgi:tetratricopeptide (TPR) repeat protein